ncbi:MAG: sigma-70 family RNA polymerase sigma factor [Planctomycetes bacterium]|nr:sigma-70 family RNA polymerase sigma factor [Planctomycetota bacterium]
MEALLMSQDVTPAAIIQRHQAGVWRYLRVLGARPEEADDITQDTFIALLRKPIEYRSERETAGWLMQAARHRFIDLRRRDRKGPSFVDMAGVNEAWLAFAGEDGGDERMAALSECVAGLEPRQRDAVKLRYSEGATRTELAQRLEVDEEGAKSLLRRVLARLRKCMEMRLGHE